MYRENAGRKLEKSQTGENKFRFSEVLFLYFSEVQKERLRSTLVARLRPGATFRAAHSGSK